MKKNETSAKQQQSKQRKADSAKQRKVNGIAAAKAAAEQTAVEQQTAAEQLTAYNGKVKQYSTAAKQVQQKTNCPAYYIKQLRALSQSNNEYYCSELTKLAEQLHFAERAAAAKAVATDAKSRRKAAEQDFITFADLCSDSSKRFCILSKVGTPNDIAAKAAAEQTAAKAADKATSIAAAARADKAETKHQAVASVKAKADKAVKQAAAAKARKFAEAYEAAAKAAEIAAAKAAAAKAAVTAAAKASETAAEQNFDLCEIDGVQFWLKPITNYSCRAILTSAQSAYRLATAEQFADLSSRAAAAKAAAKAAKETAAAAKAAEKKLALVEQKRIHLAKLQSDIAALTA